MAKASSGSYFGASAITSGVGAGAMAVGSTVMAVAPHMTGAIDIVVVEQPDGSLRSSPFYVRFGKYSNLRTQEKAVRITVNDKQADFSMHLGRTGEAYFVVESDTEEAVDKEPLPGLLSPPSGYSSTDEAAPFATKAQVHSLQAAVAEHLQQEAAAVLGPKSQGRVTEPLPGAAEAFEDPLPTLPFDHSTSAPPSLLGTVEEGPAGVALPLQGAAGGPARGEGPAFADVVAAAAEERAHDPEVLHESALVAALVQRAVLRAVEEEEQERAATPSSAAGRDTTWLADMLSDTQPLEGRGQGHSRGPLAGAMEGHGRRRTQSFDLGASEGPLGARRGKSRLRRNGERDVTSDGEAPGAHTGKRRRRFQEVAGEALSRQPSSRLARMREGRPHRQREHAAAAGSSAESLTAPKGTSTGPLGASRQAAVGGPHTGPPQTALSLLTRRPSASAPGSPRRAQELPGPAGLSQDIDGGAMSPVAGTYSEDYFRQHLDKPLPPDPPGALSHRGHPRGRMSRANSSALGPRRGDGGAGPGEAAPQGDAGAPEGQGRLHPWSVGSARLLPTPLSTGLLPATLTEAEAAAPVVSASAALHGPTAIPPAQPPPHPPGAPQPGNRKELEAMDAAVRFEGDAAPAAAAKAAQETREWERSGAMPRSVPLAHGAVAEAQDAKAARAESQGPGAAQGQAAASASREATSAAPQKAPIPPGLPQAPRGQAGHPRPAAANPAATAQPAGGAGGTGARPSSAPGAAPPGHSPRSALDAGGAAGPQPHSNGDVVPPANVEQALGTPQGAAASPFSRSPVQSQALGDAVQEPAPKPQPAASPRKAKSVQMAEQQPGEGAKREAEGRGAGPGRGLQLSLCGHELRPGMGPEEAAEAFRLLAVSEAAFRADPRGVLTNRALRVALGGRLYTWQEAAPAVLGAAAFGGAWEGALPPAGGVLLPAGSQEGLALGEVEGDSLGDKAAEEAAVAAGLNPADRRGWRTWLRSWRSGNSAASAEGGAGAKPSPAASAPARFPRSKSADSLKPPAGPAAAAVPKRTLRRAFVPSAAQLAGLGLGQGQNTVDFTFGRQRLRAYVYRFHWADKLVISDIDGTITRSDILGHFLPRVGFDWSHIGITRLYHAIRANGYHILFLSSRAIAQASATRDYLHSLNQNGFVLPEGPVIISPDGLFPSLYRELVLRRPHEFKIRCLADIQALFPPDAGPFYAGFGNRDTDELSYLAVGVPAAKIFIINPRGELRKASSSVVTSTWSSLPSLTSLVHAMFPPINAPGPAQAGGVQELQREEFNDFHFWKTAPPLIMTDSEGEGGSEGAGSQGEYGDEEGEYSGGSSESDGEFFESNSLLTSTYQPFAV